MKRLSLLSVLLLAALFSAAAQQKSLRELQQAFVDLRFGMFIHYNMPTYSIEDWPDPDMPVSAFAPTRLDCRQWAQAAKAAGMTYGCLTTKHHSGFCIWDTQTTDYNSMQSPAHVDVVRQYVDAFRQEGLAVMLYFSILDTHHRIRPGHIKPEHTKFIKAQLKELLTNYGDITALIIDGWDAPWSRISYDEISFPEIYDYVKSLQPNCLLMDLNAAKYPREALFYTDIKSYEQGAGQKISTAYCNFILNVAPNREGRMDDNAVEALRRIGKIWKHEGPTKPLPECDAPITRQNIAKQKPTEYSWSNDYGIGDFANDDDFSSAWTSHPTVEEPWWEVDLKGKKRISLVTIVEETKGSIQTYKLEYKKGKRWHTIFEGLAPECRVKQHRFSPVKAEKVRITIKRHHGKLALAEVGVY